MADKDSLAERFEANRRHLQAVAYRMLGSRSEAQDAVQEAWFRIARTDVEQVDNLRGWLTTVVARLCLDMLRARNARSEDPMPANAAERYTSDDDAVQDLELADSVGLALLAVLDSLGPAERVAFVLHDLFNLPFEEIAPIVSRSPGAVRQLASRARRRVQGSAVPETDRTRQREIVGAFLAASRDGDFTTLLTVLDPNVVLRADAVAVQMSQARQSHGAPNLAPENHGAEAVAATFKGRAQAARMALVEGVPGLVFAPGGVPRVVFDFVVEQGRIVEISLIADPATIQDLQLSMED